MFQNIQRTLIKNRQTHRLTVLQTDKNLIDVTYVGLHVYDDIQLCIKKHTFL